jgi:dihydrofolate reductase
VVGKGQRLFPDGVDPVTLKLLDTRSYDKGIVVLVYAPAEEDTSEQAS